MDRKDCPLNIVEDVDGGRVPDYCSEEKCAWWNKKDKECAVAAIAWALQQIASKVSLG